MQTIRDVLTGQVKEPTRGRRTRSRKLFNAFAAGSRHRGRDVGKIRWLVSARGRLRPHIAWQKVGAVGFEHQLCGGNLTHQRQQVRASPLVVDPAGDADVESQLKTVLELVCLTREAVRDGACRKRVRVFSQNRDEVCMRIALMQEDRLAHSRGDLQLSRERSSLHVARRKIAKVIEAAFSDGDDFGRVRERFQRFTRLTCELDGVMWMNARGCEQSLRMPVHQCRSFAGAFDAGARDDHLDDAGRRGTGHDGVPVAVITIVGEVDSDVDQHVRSGG